MSLRFWEHYQKACEKHPFFANSIMHPHPLAVSEGLRGGQSIAETEMRNKHLIDLFNSIVVGNKHISKNSPSAENVLAAEVAEIWLAVAEGNLEQARYEIADAVAVLIRLDEQLEELHKRQLNPSTYKDKNNGKEA